MDFVSEEPGELQNVSTRWCPPPSVDVTKPYEFMGFGAIDVTKPFKSIRFGAIDVAKPHESIWFEASMSPTPMSL